MEKVEFTTTMSRAGMVVVLVAMVSALLAAAVATSSPSEAFCQGSSSYSWSVGWGKERSQSAGTCDGLGDYWGQVADGASDGDCVDLYSKDNAGSSWTFRKRSCTVNVYETFNYNYADENAYFKVCKNNTGTCAAQQYNWGF